MSATSTGSCSALLPTASGSRPATNPATSRSASVASSNATGSCPNSSPCAPQASSVLAVSPLEVRPFPKAPSRSESSRGRKRGKSSILTNSPVKRALIEETSKKKYNGKGKGKGKKPNSRRHHYQKTKRMNVIVLCLWSSMPTVSLVRSGLNVKSAKSGPMGPAALVIHNIYASIVNPRTNI
ncbi:hypothetical protein ElyMa_000927800 [Elysia marginata]|uniref:Uncharacterized protein n=1 Tax=Elysia marginata TaxID=1093978 RepID=A0AAV4H944_9GAST|nr:hypothetical protein ElyMa_000927800 [Elysia marginata]